MLKAIVQWRAGDLSLQADSKVVSIIPVLVRATDDDERGTGITHPSLSAAVGAYSPRF